MCKCLPSVSFWGKQAPPDICPNVYVYPPLYGVNVNMTCEQNLGVYHVFTWRVNTSGDDMNKISEIEQYTYPLVQWNID